MKSFSAFLNMRKCKNWAYKISFWKYLPVWRPVLPVFPCAQSASFMLSTLNYFQGVLKASSCSSSWFNPCGYRWKFSWQVPVCSWHSSQRVSMRIKWANIRKALNPIHSTYVLNKCKLSLQYTQVCVLLFHWTLFTIHISREI